MAFKRLEYTKSWERDDPDTGFIRYETSETQVRKDIQFLHDEVKNFINDGFMQELESVGSEQPEDLSGADHIGDKYEGTVGATLAALFARAAANHEDILSLAGGGVPDVVKSSVVDFTAEGWAEIGGTSAPARDLAAGCAARAAAAPGRRFAPMWAMTATPRTLC